MRRYNISFIVCLIAIFWATTSYAIMAYIDQFTITRDGTTVLNDTFTDGVPPPSGPAGADTYFLSQGTPGPESGGLLELNTANGSFSANAIETPRVVVVVTRLTCIIDCPVGSSKLGNTNLLKETGLFSFTIPTGPQFQAYGIRFSDNVADRTGHGQLVQLFVRFNDTDGKPEIAYVLQDFEHNIITPLGAPVDLLASLKSLSELQNPVVPDQILFTLSQSVAGGSFCGSYEFFENNLDTGHGGAFNCGTLFNGVDYVRGQFFAAQGVPEPETWLLMGVGVLGLVLVARRRGKI